MSALLPLTQRDGFIWMNGKWIEWKSAQVHLLTHGLHYGSSVFEGVRMYNGKVFKNREHNIRFKKSAELLGFTIPYEVEELDEVCIEACKKNNLTNAYLRPVAWLGGETLKIYIPELSVNVAVAAWEMGNYFTAEAKLEGIRTILADYKRPSPETAPSASKAAGLYMICTISKRNAHNKGYDDALMLDYRGYIAEFTGANIFLIMDGQIHTPVADSFLNGITRLTVIDIAKQLGYTVVERHILPEELSKASDVFLTGTAAEITRVKHINMHNVSYDYKPHQITQNLVKAFHETVNN
jgi:branched-chain amino acid aminotransferase